MAEEKPPVETQVSAPAVEAAVASPSALGPDVKPEPVAQTEIVKAVEVKAEEKPVESPKEEAKTEVKLEEAKKDEKPVETKAEEKPTEVKVEPKPVEPPKFEALVLPEGVKLEDKQIGEIDSMFGSFELASKAPHEEVQKLRQGMVEYGIGFVNDAIAKVNQQAQAYWEQKTKEYREAFEKDPEIGGNRKDTTTEAARQFIAQHAGSSERAAEVRKVLQEHKLDNHPAIIRLLANANLARSEAKPLPAQKAVPAKMSKLDKFYGNMKE